MLIAILFATGCTTSQIKTPVTNGAALSLQAEKEFQNNNLHAAARLFTLAQENYTAAGNNAASLNSRDRATTAKMMVLEYPYNRSRIDDMINARFPDIPADRKASWLPCDQSQCIESDGEFWYLDKTISNIQYHNMDIMRKMTAAKGDTPFYDQLIPYAFVPEVPSKGNYINPMIWEGDEQLSIPSDKLPKNGFLHVWGSSARRDRFAEECHYHISRTGAIFQINNRHECRHWNSLLRDPAGEHYW